MGTLGATRRFFSDRLMGRHVLFSHVHWTVGRVIARVQGQCQAFHFGLVFSLATMRYGRALSARGLVARWSFNRASGLELC